MSNNILLYIYSFKMDKLGQYVFDLLDKSSKENQITVVIDDQNNLERSDTFSDYKNIRYRPIWWDEWISPLKYQKESIEKNRPSNYQYILLLSDKVEMPDNWDADLINMLKPESVISGIGSMSPSIKNFFNISKNYTESESITLTNFIDSRLIFTHMMTYKTLNLPLDLKYYGVDEYLSMQLLNHGKTIWSLPSTYKYSEDGFVNKDYIPFSLYHNYNDVVKILKNQKPEKIQWVDPMLFLKSINLNINNLYEFPYDVNDVEYTTDLPIDNKSLNKLFSNINTLS